MKTQIKIILIITLSILLIFFFSLFLLSRNTLKVSWINLTSSSINTKPITVTFRKNNKTYSRSLIPFESDKIRISCNSKVTGNEHSASYKLKVYPSIFTKDTKTIEMYIFPNKEIEETQDSYIVKEINNPSLYGYFIEAWDAHEKRNYYIVSKDNIINKPKVIYEEEVSLDLLTSDTAYYNNDSQPLLEAYNGYIMKSEEDNSYVELSTLWDW